MEFKYEPIFLPIPRDATKTPHWILYFSFLNFTATHGQREYNWHRLFLFWSLKLDMIIETVKLSLPVEPTCTWWPHKHYSTMDVPTHDYSHAQRWMSACTSLSAVTSEEELIIHCGTHSCSRAHFTMWWVWFCLNWSIMYLRLALQGHPHGKPPAALYMLINHNGIICDAPRPIWTSNPNPLSQSFIFRMRSWS